MNGVSRNDGRFLDPRNDLRDIAGQFAAFSDNGFGELDPVARNLALLQLFHTPPSKPRIHSYRVPVGDPKALAKWLGHERVPLPQPEEFAQKIDFHRVVAAINQYPILLRRLGLVVDLSIRRTDLTPQTGDLWITVELPSSPVTSTTQPLRTRTRLDANVFEAVPRPAPKAGDYRVKEGRLELQPGVFGLLQADIDGGALKLMNFARTLNGAKVQAQELDPVTQKPHEVGAPALRNSGLMLVHSQRAKMLENSFQRQKSLDGAAMATPLFAEDLVRGFRIDIWDDVSGQWHSLCSRSATYELNGGEVVVETAHEEGMLRLAATKSSDSTSHPDLVWLHESLLTWSGWSLCAPPPGRAVHHGQNHVDEVGAPEAELPPGLRLTSRFAALKGSLPRLRYGRKYWIRARVVDLAANSLPPSKKDFGNEKPEQNAVPYLRFEPISAPVLALVKPTLETVEVPMEGESMERLAIRSFNDTPADNLVPSPQRARRFALPSRTTQREAEQHGLFDRAGILDSSFFSLLAEQDHALFEELVPTSGPMAEKMETRFAALIDGDPLPYLPEPLALVIAARFFDHPEIAPDRILEIPFYPGRSAWPKALPFKITLYEGPGEEPRYEPAEHTLFVPLPKGERATLRLSVRPRRFDLGLLGVWGWLSQREQEQQVALARRGQHFLLTPWRSLELVHATQRPLITPEILDHEITRSSGATSAHLHVLATCSLKSTDHLDVLAAWNEPDVAADPAAGGANRARRDVAFRVKITTPKQYAGKSDHNIVGDDRIRAGGHFDDGVELKVHEFGDTRYRRIEYHLAGTTRFREFLPKHLLAKELADGTFEPIDDHIKVEGPVLRTFIPSSAPPPAPNVLYVVPTFGWVRTEEETRKRSWRRGGGLRIYLDGPWNVSGYGEMLAVVVPSAAFQQDPNVEPSAQPLKNFVTQWGNDPIWKSGFVAGATPRRSDFPLARTAPDPSGAWLPAFAPQVEADQPPGPFKTTELSHPEAAPLAESRVEIAPHDVFFDEERRLWYADVEVDTGTAYFPFIRLALARYQPVSVEDHHLSHIVLADLMSLAPDRWLSVTRTDDPRTLRVNVQGSGFSDSSSHIEAENAPARSILRADGTVVEERPPELSRSSVIEIRVERFDPAFGDDFGWRPASGAVVEEQLSLNETHVANPRLQRRARQLFSQRRFDVLLREDLIGRVFAAPSLWRGRVLLPDHEPDVRFRLVVAEYEEYLVDDTTPYDRFITAKDRRLVFIEYVALA